MGGDRSQITRPIQPARTVRREIGPRVRAIPEGDDRERLVCPECTFIEYANPRVVVGAVVHWDGRIVLCRRAISPRPGFWTIPAGYLELHETAEAGALREVWEEAQARVELDGLMAVYNIPRLSLVQLVFRARLLDGKIAAGPESQEVGFFAWDEIPWNDLAFPSTRWALDHFREIGHAAEFAARSNPPGESGDY
ncbi:MAG: NUDIX hydrolase [Alphaproteobacteria bacterium]|nr:NUDIX hydrolase [Alphaproteobacteria bacterium]